MIHDSRFTNRAASVAALFALGLVSLVAAGSEEADAGSQPAQDAPRDEDATREPQGAPESGAEGERGERVHYHERDRGRGLPMEDAPGVPAGGLGDFDGI